MEISLGYQMGPILNLGDKPDYEKSRGSEVYNSEDLDTSIGSMDVCCWFSSGIFCIHSLIYQIEPIKI